MRNRENPDVQEDTEQKTSRRLSKEFNLKLDRELKKIPDYTPLSSRRRRKRGLTVFAKIMVAIIIVGISIFLALAIIFSAQEIFGLNKPDKSIMVEIAPNSGVQQIAEELEAKGVIQSAEMFRAYYKLAKLNGKFQYGSYSLNSNMSYEMIVNELSKYSTVRDEISVTFPEGFTLYQMAQRLEAKGVCKADDFINVLNTHDFGYDFEKGISENPLRYHKLEGYLFPDTYNFFKNDNPVNVAAKMLSNFDKKCSPELQAKFEKLGFTLEDAITVASIVQKEAGDTEEMRKVASVYFNRLKNKGEYPNLQADPTKGYARELKLQMSITDQEILDAYDTYEGKGLPPGPICNPGIDALNAVADPEQTEYYYFCSNLDTREFFYAKTLNEHEKNLRKAGLA